MEDCNLLSRSREIISRSIEMGLVHKVETDERIIKEQGIDFSVSLSTNIVKKEGDKRKGDVFETINPDIRIAEIGDFVIIPNYYAILPDHLLAISKEFVHQISRLSLKDAEVITSILNKDYILCYNGGPGSGASQMHRHFHVILSLCSHTIPLAELVKKGLFQTTFPTSALEFFNKDLEHEFISNSETEERHHVHLLTAPEVLCIIRKCERKASIRVCKTTSGKELEGWDRTHCSVIPNEEGEVDNSNITYYKDDFSLVICKYFCALFPRFLGAPHGRNLNSISFTGCVFVKNLEDFNTIVKDTIVGTLSSASLNK